MKANLSEFLVGIASDPDRMSRFVSDPDGEAGAAGLTDDEQTAVLSRDSRQVLGALAATGFGNGDTSMDKKKKKKKRRPKRKPPYKPGKPGRKAPGRKRPARKKR